MHVDEELKKLQSLASMLTFEEEEIFSHEVPSEKYPTGQQLVPYK